VSRMVKESVSYADRVFGFLLGGASGELDAIYRNIKRRWLPVKLRTIDMAKVKKSVGLSLWSFREDTQIIIGKNNYWQN